MGKIAAQFAFHPFVGIWFVDTGVMYGAVAWNRWTSDLKASAILLNTLTSAVGLKVIWRHSKMPRLGTFLLRRITIGRLDSWNIRTSYDIDRFLIVTPYCFVSSLGLSPMPFTYISIFMEIEDHQLVESTFSVFSADISYAIMNAKIPSAKWLADFAVVPSKMYICTHATTAWFTPRVRKFGFL